MPDAAKIVVVHTHWHLPNTSSLVVWHLCTKWHLAGSDGHLPHSVAAEVVVWWHHYLPRLHVHHRLHLPHWHLLPHRLHLTHTHAIIVHVHRHLTDRHLSRVVVVDHVLCRRHLSSCVVAHWVLHLTGWDVIDPAAHHG